MKPKTYIGPTGYGYYADYNRAAVHIQVITAERREREEAEILERLIERGERPDLERQNTA